MSGQLVRARWLTGAADFMRAHFSPETQERLHEHLPRDVKQALPRLQPADWCPRAHHVELMNAIASAHRDEARAYDDLLAYGQYLGADMSSGVLRPFMQIATFKLFAKKLPAIWLSEHQDDSRLESDISQLEESRLLIRIHGLRGYNHGGIAMLGWIKGALSRLSRRPIQVKQSGWSVSQPAPLEINAEVTWS